MTRCRLRVGAVVAAIALVLAPAARAACVTCCVPSASRTACASPDGDACGVLRETVGATSNRAGHDVVPLVATALPAVGRGPDRPRLPARGRPAARPPGSASTPLPLRI